MTRAQNDMRAAQQGPSELVEGVEPRPPKFMILEQNGGVAPAARSAAWTAIMAEGPVRPLTAVSRLSDAFFAAARRFASKTALVTARHTYSYAELAQQALCVADRLLADPDYQPGDRVALMLDNGPEFIAALYGILTAGGVLVPLPANVERNRLEQISRICGAKKILTSRRMVRRRAEVADDQCELIDLAAAAPSKIPTVTPLTIGGHTLAMILFTSGSSGDPKGVMLSDSNLLANTESILRYLPITQNDRVLALLPFYHAFGHSILQTHLLTGATLVVDGNMAFPNTVVDALERHRATSFSAVPEGYYSLMSMSDLRERDLPHLRYMSVAGGALKPSAVVEMAQAISPAEFFVMYGQTEASARLAYLPAHLAPVHPNSIGQAIPGVELRVLDQNGHEAALNETGELCARGANVMLGYWHDDAGTRKVLRDGWLRTGDLASRDEAGYFYVKARKNDLIKVQGFRIHPREVEDAVAQHFPGLRLIVVPYQHAGTTRLALYAVTSQADPQLADELRRVCVRELPRHKIPSHVEVLDRAPLNASMKLDRTALKRRAELRAGQATDGEPDPCPLRKLSA